LKERLVEILVYLMAEMTQKRIGEVNLAALEDRGYTRAEINEAFDWLTEHVQIDSGGFIPLSSRASRRQLHAVERVVISTEGQGYLMQLCELGLLDTADLETVIERAMGLGVEGLSAAEMHQLVASVLFMRQSTKRGGGFMMNNNDTVH
jgi:uncharacterized protein Smg (DUF494 family)